MTDAHTEILLKHAKPNDPHDEEKNDRYFIRVDKYRLLFKLTDLEIILVIKHG